MNKRRRGEKRGERREKLGGRQPRGEVKGRRGEGLGVLVARFLAKHKLINGLKDNKKRWKLRGERREQNGVDRGG